AVRGPQMGPHGAAVVARAGGEVEAIPLNEEAAGRGERRQADHRQRAGARAVGPPEADAGGVVGEEEGVPLEGHEAMRGAAAGPRNDLAQAAGPRRRAVAPPQLAPPRRRASREEQRVAENEGGDRRRVLAPAFEAWLNPERESPLPGAVGPPEADRVPVRVVDQDRGGEEGHVPRCAQEPQMPREAAQPLRAG